MTKSDAEALVDGFEKAFLDRMLVETDNRKRAYEKARQTLVVALRNAVAAEARLHPCYFCNRPVDTQRAEVWVNDAEPCCEDCEETPPAEMTEIGPE